MTRPEYPSTPAPVATAGGPGTTTSTHPPILVREGDERRLYEIAVGAMLSDPRLAGGLLDELSRATVAPDALVPAEVVGLGSTATYRDAGEPGSATHRVRIVAPQDADTRRGRVSVLSDLGAALIGLAPGQSILWRDRVGGIRQLAVINVETARPFDESRG